MKLIGIYLIINVFVAAAIGTSIFNPVCSQNETYQTCYDGCEYTCENYATAGACAGVCNPEFDGCYCNSGFVRNINGACVSYDDCTRAPETVEPQKPSCKGKRKRFIPFGTL